jgi:hypothetical protein
MLSYERKEAAKVEKKNIFIQARTTPEVKKSLTIYAAQHDTSIQAILETYVQTLLELEVSPEKAIKAIREYAKKPGDE